MSTTYSVMKMKEMVGVVGLDDWLKGRIDATRSDVKEVA